MCAGATRQSQHTGQVNYGSGCAGLIAENNGDVCDMNNNYRVHRNDRTDSNNKLTMTEEGEGGTPSFAPACLQSCERSEIGRDAELKGTDATSG